MADFAVFIQQQVEQIKPIVTIELNFILKHYSENTIHYVNELLGVQLTNDDNTEQNRIATPKSSRKSANSKPIQKRTYNELIQIKAPQQWKPEDSNHSQQQFIDLFNWQRTSLTADEKSEGTLVDIHEIFSQQKFSVGTNHYFTIKFTRSAGH